MALLASIIDHLIIRHALYSKSSTHAPRTPNLPHPTLELFPVQRTRLAALAIKAEKMVTSLRRESRLWVLARACKTKVSTHTKGALTPGVEGAMREP